MDVHRPPRLNVSIERSPSQITFHFHNSNEITFGRMTRERLPPFYAFLDQLAIALVFWMRGPSFGYSMSAPAIRLLVHLADACQDEFVTAMMWLFEHWFGQKHHIWAYLRLMNETLTALRLLSDREFDLGHHFVSADIDERLSFRFISSYIYQVGFDEINYD